jgi:hypothetical protein
MRGSGRDVENRGGLAPATPAVGTVEGMTWFMPRDYWKYDEDDVTVPPCCKARRAGKSSYGQGIVAAAGETKLWFPGAVWGRTADDEQGYVGWPLSSVNTWLPGFFNKLTQRYECCFDPRANVPIYTQLIDEIDTSESGEAETSQSIGRDEKLKFEWDAGGGEEIGLPSGDIVVPASTWMWVGWSFDKNAWVVMFMPQHEVEVQVDTRVDGEEFLLEKKVKKIYVSPIEEVEEELGEGEEEEDRGWETVDEGDNCEDEEELPPE